MNVKNLLKLVEFGQKELTIEEWDFSLQKNRGEAGCLIDPINKKKDLQLKYLGFDFRSETFFDFLGITIDEFEWIFPYPSERRNTYSKPLSEVTKEDVINRIHKFINWKFKREHKWKQYLYSVYGQAVTDKRNLVEV